MKCNFKESDGRFVGYKTFWGMVMCLWSANRNLRKQDYAMDFCVRLPIRKKSK